MKRLALLLLLLTPLSVEAQNTPPAASFSITAQVVPAPPEPTPAPPIVIDGGQATPVGTVLEFRATTKDGQPCAWLVEPEAPGFRTVYDKDGVPYGMFPAFTRGSWTVIAAVNGEPGKPPNTARYPFIVGEPIPVPPTPPVPPPPIPPEPPVPPIPPPTPAGPRWVIILEESAERTPQLAAVITSPSLRDYLSANKHHPLRLADKDATEAWVKPYLAVLPANARLPQLLIVADPTAGSSGAKMLFVGPVPATDAEVIAELKKAGG